MSEYNPGEVNQTKVIDLKTKALNDSVNSIKARIEEIIREIESGVTPGRALDLIGLLTTTNSVAGGTQGLQQLGFEIDSQINDLINAIRGMSADQSFGDIMTLNLSLEQLQEMRRVLQSNLAQATTVADQESRKGKAFQTQVAGIQELLKAGNLEFMPEIWSNMSTYDREVYSRYDPEGAQYLNSLAPAPSGSVTQSSTKTATGTGTGTGTGGTTAPKTSAPVAPQPTRAPFPIVGNLAGKPVYGRDADGMPPSDKTIQESMQGGEGFTFVQKSNGLEFIPLGGGPGMGFSYDYLKNADLDALGFTGELKDSLANVQAALQEEESYYNQVMLERNEQAMVYEREAAEQQRGDLLDQLSPGSRMRLQSQDNLTNTQAIIDMLGREQAQQAEDERKTEEQKRHDARYLPGNAPIVSNP